MVRKSPASNFWVEILKNTNVCKRFLKVTKSFSSSGIFSVFIINGSINVKPN